MCRDMNDVQPFDMVYKKKNRQASQGNDIFWSPIRRLHQGMEYFYLLKRHVPE